MIRVFQVHVMLVLGWDINRVTWGWSNFYSSNYVFNTGILQWLIYGESTEIILCSQSGPMRNVAVYCTNLTIHRFTGCDM